MGDVVEFNKPLSVKADIARYEVEHRKVADTKALDELYRRLLRLLRHPRRPRTSRLITRTGCSALPVGVITPHIQSGRINAGEKWRLNDITDIRRTEIIEARPRHLRPPMFS